MAAAVVERIVEAQLLMFQGPSHTSPVRHLGAMACALYSSMKEAVMEYFLALQLGTRLQWTMGYLFEHAVLLLVRLGMGGSHEIAWPR